MKLESSMFVLAMAVVHGSALAQDGHHHAHDAMDHGAMHASPVSGDQGDTEVQVLVDGEVRKVDTAQGKVTLRHGPLSHLGMDTPMTMVFRVAEPTMLASLQSGDKIRFRAERVNGALTVMALEKLN